MKAGTAAQERYYRLLERSRLREVFQAQETEDMEVGTEGGEQEGIASQSVEKDVRTDVAGSDIDNLRHVCLDAQDHTANLKYHVFDKERVDPDETRVSFTLDYLAKSSLFTQFTQSTVSHNFCHTIDAMFNRL